MLYYIIDVFRCSDLPLLFVCNFFNLDIIYITFLFFLFKTFFCFNDFGLYLIDLLAQFRVDSIETWFLCLHLDCSKC